MEPFQIVELEVEIGALVGEPGGCVRAAWAAEVEVRVGESPKQPTTPTTATTRMLAVPISDPLLSDRSKRTDFKQEDLSSIEHQVDLAVVQPRT